MFVLLFSFCGACTFIIGILLQVPGTCNNSFLGSMYFFYFPKGF